MIYDINRGELDELTEPTREEKKVKELEAEVARLRAIINEAASLGNSDYNCSSSDIVEDMVSILWKA